jgi:hypothetical protein
MNDYTKIYEALVRIKATLEVGLKEKVYEPLTGSYGTLNKKALWDSVNEIESFIKNNQLITNGLNETLSELKDK